MSIKNCSRWRVIFITIIVLIVLIEIHSIFFLMPANYTLVSHMEDLRHARISLYQVHGRTKFFMESESDNHLDRQYSQDRYIDKNETIQTLYYLFEQFFDWLQHNESISSLKTAYLSPDIMPSQYLFHFDIKPSHGLIYFLDYGTLLGSYRNQSIVPWDVNGDIGFMMKDLQQLPLEYDRDTWIFKQNPAFYDGDGMTVYDSHNTVAARVISKENGVFINIMPYSLIHKADPDVTDLIYVYSTADFLQHEKWHQAKDLFPINTTGGTLKHLTQLPVPRNVQKWLLTYYSSLTVPDEHKYNPVPNADYNAYRDQYYGYGYGTEHIKQLKQQLEEQKEEIEKLKELILSKRNNSRT